MRRPIIFPYVLVAASVLAFISFGAAVVIANDPASFRDYFGILRPGTRYAKISVAASGETTLVTPASGYRVRVKDITISCSALAVVDIDVHFGTTQTDANSFIGGIFGSRQGVSHHYGDYGPTSDAVDVPLRTKHSSTSAVVYYVTWTEEP